ncbi:MAG: phenylalanine--tRNA ligase subunit beta, partial [Bacteroidales bacterium]|nr:phenylalanine--tRNA ligase subunit beta [Bacteroidales bacterium]
NWLKEFIELPLDPQQTADALTSIGLETGGVEEVQSIKGGLKGIVTGKVLTCEEHPNSDHLHITTVDLGTGEPTQIVCGAPNVAAGQYVIVATVGTILYDGEESFTIKKSKIRGVESFGMICAEDEIGIGNNHDGIIVLKDTPTPGTPAADYFGIKSDYVIEVDITPNRIDAASHYGVARDLAAYLKRNGYNYSLTKPSVDNFAIDNTDGDAVKVIVENTEAAPRYAGLTIKGVTVKESPDWLKQRLNTIGVRPINNIVDITNYILHETGQPLHCFDKNGISGNTVIVKTLPEGTPFVTLDEVERKLSNKDLMICNQNEGMCIAGVFGGLKSGVTEKTTDVFLESAYFNPTWIRKSARRHGLNTDASFRFERGIDPNTTVYVLKRAAMLIKEIAGGEIVGDIIDIYPEKIAPYPVTLTYNRVTSLIGKEISEEIVKDILTSLEIEIVSEENGTLELKVPTYRVDVRRDCDVIEDILRIYGYNNVEITESVHSNLSNKSVADEQHSRYNTIANELTGCGFNEKLNNSLTKTSYYKDLTSFPESNCVKVMNPLSSDLGVMRQTLLFGGLESVAYNINRRNGDLKFYEFGNCYSFNPDADTVKGVLAPYSEEYRLGIWLTGYEVANSWAQKEIQTSFFMLKGYVENVLTRLGMKGKYTTEQTSDDIYSTVLVYKTRGGKEIGKAGIVSKNILRKFDIDCEVYFAEFNFAMLCKESVKTKTTYSELSKFPPVKRDLALLVDTSVKFSEIEKVARESERKLLKEVSLFDVYEGKNLEPGKKSYAVSFILQDAEKTLADKQIDAVMNKIITNLENKVGAKLR